jgi:prepilin-type N-terminal cleavage/methylation domain-containing protein
LKKKSAFTLIELIFVIIVLGILASLAMDRMDRDIKTEASETILADIRLAHQLALRDNKHLPDNNSSWQKAYWRVDFNIDDNYRYAVVSDRDLSSSITKDESAIDASTGKYLYNDLSNDSSLSKKVLLEEKFSIMDINSSGGCDLDEEKQVISIAFDYLGRVHSNAFSYEDANFSNILTDDCNLTFTISTSESNILDNFIITVCQETGYSFIYNDENTTCSNLI